MTTTLKNLLKKLPDVRRKKINNRAKELLAQEMTLPSSDHAALVKYLCIS